MKNFLKKLIPDFLIGLYHFKWSLFFALIYRLPSRKIKVIGVTGTNGKSTVVHLLSGILEEAGYKVASISSIRFKIGKEVWTNKLKMTMPGHGEIHRFLRRAVNQGCQYAVLEITSEGIRQFRHSFVDFEAAVFTNLTPEHIESHKGFENYKQAKGKLFKAVKPEGKIIVNLDDPNAGYFLGFPAKEKYGYAINKQPEVPDLKMIIGQEIKLSSLGIDFSVENTQFHLKLLGKFNVSNALAAIGAALAERIPLEKIEAALAKAETIPGRLEIVIEEPFVAAVDYAHTPDALEKVYQTIREIHSGRIIAVLGAAGGGRDKWKRPEMGKIAGRFCDYIILTNEDPYDEDPQEIISQIKQGIDKTDIPLEIILDRKKAIGRALSLAQNGDIVIITGKGCEPWMCVKGGKKIPWDDRQIVREEMLSLRGANRQSAESDAAISN
jgi:UDP-N-acetylmuramoyl-L-alanyl-D-glutamate--2,6-diaminopimelate ligase